MENSIIVNGKELRKFNDTYYVSAYGEVYSTYCRRFIKPLLRGRGAKRYFYVDIFFDGKQHHVPIHRIVYTSWIGEIPAGGQINHIDDNSENNYYKNLYCGNQKQNIHDCFINNHRCGNVWYLTVFDKEKNKIVSFCPASKFIEYSGHPCKNRNVNRCFSRNWFKKRYSIIEYKLLKNNRELKSVTTMGDECSPVGQSLSLSEARCCM